MKRKAGEFYTYFDDYENNIYLIRWDRMRPI